MHIFTKILQIILKSRYQINITWLDEISEDKPVLIFPSHIAFIDPVILYAFLRTKWKICPAVSEEYYNKPILNLIFHKIWAIPVIDVDKEQKKLKSESLMNEISNKLNEGNKILLYPQWAMAISH